MNEIDVPKFRGKGKLGDFVKKHKKKIEVASGLAALSLPFLTYLALKDNKGQAPAPAPAPRQAPEEKKDSGYPRGIPPQRPLGFFIVSPEKAHAEYFKSKRGGKSNPLAKKVMAYKKKHGCSLKEAWAQFK